MNEFGLLSIRHVIISRGRHRTIASHKLFPSATVVVPESERGAYSLIGEIEPRLETIPDRYEGISAVRNWVVAHFPEEAIVIIDDDICACICMVSLRCKKLSIEETAAVIENTAYCARGAGAGLFGWHQRSDPKLLQRNDPFGVTHWVGGVVGVIGKAPHWDELLRCKCDIDACLNEFLERRIVWQDSRFCFQQKRDKNLGGNSIFRTQERIEVEQRYLKKKWQAHIRFENYKTQDRVAMDVTRRQHVALISKGMLV